MLSLLQRSDFCGYVPIVQSLCSIMHTFDVWFNVLKKIGQGKSYNKGFVSLWDDNFHQKNEKNSTKSSRLLMRLEASSVCVHVQKSRLFDTFLLFPGLPIFLQLTSSSKIIRASKLWLNHSDFFWYSLMSLTDFPGWLELRNKNMLSENNEE